MDPMEAPISLRRLACINRHSATKTSMANPSPANAAGIGSRLNGWKWYPMATHAAAKMDRNAIRSPMLPKLPLLNGALRDVLGMKISGDSELSVRPGRTGLRSMTTSYYFDKCYAL